METKANCYYCGKDKQLKLVKKRGRWKGEVEEYYICYTCAHKEASFTINQVNSKKVA